jgi:DNA-binding NarL/FixJ family response regulator
MRVVVADDAVILREGLARLLTETGFEVVGLAGDAEELLDQVRTRSPDVAIVDIRMPPTHTDEGLRAAKSIRRTHPQVGVLVLSQHVHADYAIGREREVLAEMAQGRSNKAIAERLCVTEHTIEKHVKHIFETLRLASSPDDHRRVLAVVTFLNAQ